MVEDINGWELLNDKQKVVVKSFREVKTSYMHWHAKTNIKKPRKILSFIVALMI